MSTAGGGGEDALRAVLTARASQKFNLNIFIQP